MRITLDFSQTTFSFNGYADTRDEERKKGKDRKVILYFKQEIGDYRRIDRPYIDLEMTERQFEEVEEQMKSIRDRLNKEKETV